MVGLFKKEAIKQKTQKMVLNKYETKRYTVERFKKSQIPYGKWDLYVDLLYSAKNKIRTKNRAVNKITQQQEPLPQKQPQQQEPPLQELQPERSQKLHLQEPSPQPPCGSEQ